MQLTQDLGDIKKGVKALDQAIKKQSDKPQDKIKEKLDSYFKNLTTVVEDLEKKIKECEAEYEKTAKFFCENPKDASEKLAEKFFKLWNSCKNCKKEIERLKLAAKKEAEKKAKDEQKKAADLQKAAGPKKVGFEKEEEEKPKGNVKTMPGFYTFFVKQKFF